jgi:hypothetical protein
MNFVRKAMAYLKVLFLVPTFHLLVIKLTFNVASIDLFLVLQHAT